MDKYRIINYLSTNGLSDIEEVSLDGDGLALKFYYDFDDMEIQAARACANDETDYEEESNSWIMEGVIPYLDDVATDGVEEILEEIMEEFQVIGKAEGYEIEYANYSGKQFLAVFLPDHEELEIDDILDELK
ncbi:hypothetical protein [Clostridium sp.]|uniref:hypothetical protein n=1 Tax=Clostridium sp. TaxID=1506 RepID=UPI002618B033|nr:hypothetical protein [Clostridium sp.]